MTTYSLAYHVADDCPTCPWCVFRNDGELMAGFETEQEARDFAAELEDEARQFAEMAIEEARAEAEALAEEAMIEAEALAELAEAA